MDVEIPTRGKPLSAWFAPADSDHWVVHVQGIRTTREVTLPSLELTVNAGYPSLSVTFRGCGEDSATPASMLGQEEWRDLRDAIAYARTNGAARVTVIGWSFGAAIALELSRREPHLVNHQILIAPVTNWPETIVHGATRAKLPAIVGKLVCFFLRTRVAAKVLHLPSPIDVRHLRWDAPSALSIPTTVLHGPGDEVVPFEHSVKFCAVHSRLATLIEFPPCPHGWLALADAQRFESAVLAALDKSEQ